MAKDMVLSNVSTGASCAGAGGAAWTSSTANSNAGFDMVWSMASGNTRIKVMAWMMEFAASCKSAISPQEVRAKLCHLAVPLYKNT